MKRLDDIIGAMHAEIKRSMEELRMPHDTSVVPQYISYCLEVNDILDISSDLGCTSSSRSRDAQVHIEVRVGKDGDINAGHYHDALNFYGDPSGDAMRVVLWRFTDDIFKEAFKNYLRRKRIRLESQSRLRETPLEFMATGPLRYRGQGCEQGIDEDMWLQLAAECTDLFTRDPDINTSGFDLQQVQGTRVLVNSEGSEIVSSSSFYSIDLSTTAIAVRGGLRKQENMIESSRQFYVSRKADLPDRAALMEATESMIGDVGALLEAPVQKPYDRPAVCDPEFGGQLFYTILGELITGRCSYLHHLEDQGLKKSKSIMPEFISVSDRPDRRTFVQPDGTRVHLNGHCRYDHQGVPAARMDLVTGGRIAGFPCTREYIKDLQLPNGRARYEADYVLPAVTNLFVNSSNRFEADALREMLIAECDERGYDYGFYLVGALASEFDTEENCFILTPKMAYRLWAVDGVDGDTGERYGRGDLQLVSDVQVVGNPIMTLSYLQATGDDPSAMVPGEVERRFFEESSSYHQGGECSVIAPSLYFSRIEIKKENYSKLRNLLLPHPLHEGGDGDGDV